MTPKIEMAGVKKAFGAKKVLRGVDLKVNKGESLVIIGGSGTGTSVAVTPSSAPSPSSARCTIGDGNMPPASIACADPPRSSPRPAP